MALSQARRGERQPKSAPSASKTEKKEKAPKPKAPKTEEDIDLDDDEAWHEGEDEAGISQKGLERMMRALGKDGLSEMDLAMLEQIRGDEEEEDDDDDEEEEEEEEDDDDNEEEEKEGEDDDDDEEEEEKEGEDDDDNEDDDDDEEDKSIDEAEEEDEDEDEDASMSAPKDSLAASILRSGLVPEEDEEEDDDDDEEDEEEENNDDDELVEMDKLAADAPLSEEALASRHNRIRINRTDALERLYQDFRLDGPSSRGTMPWIETMALTYEKTLAEEVPDAQNDLDRELAFYRQSLDAAMRGRERVLAAKVPFTRPNDYFAEMLKTDEHMERVRQRLLDESASIKASEDAKRQRELKKYGKKIQTEKLMERQRNKREMEDKVNSLKRKRQSGLELNDDEFDVQLEEALGERKETARRARGKMSRQSRDQKYGFGGKKRHQKSNTAASTDDFGGAVRRGKPGQRPKAKKTQRPGKSKRAARR